MIRQMLRAIFRTRETEARIAFLKTRMSHLEYEQEKLMSRIEDLASIVVEVGSAVDAVISLVNEQAARLSVAGVEDPRVGEAADALASIKARLAAVIPAAPVPDVAPEPVAG